MSTNHQTVAMLQQAYMMELETVANYLANSVHLDGIQAEEIKRALTTDVAAELTHARRLAERMKQLGGRIPGSLELKRTQGLLQPPEESTDVGSVIDGVLEAEEEAIAHYRTIIEATDGTDFVTQDLAISLMADEEQHRRQFEGFRTGLHAATVPAGV